ncbi:MAG TPA: class I SAM-dependent methyltransferase [Herpetosiphonaceae bacterium]
MIDTLELLAADQWQDYALLDSGHGQKLERFGPVTVVRPEQQAIWAPQLPEREWARADAVFEHQGGKGDNWRQQRPVPQQWAMRYRDLSFRASLTPFRHVGVFPEQAPQWDWAAELIRARAMPPRVLNLFAYTGLASVSAAKAGAQVVHLDASKPSVDWAKANQQASGLPPDSIRWIIDDALKFVRREARRGSRYDGIIMDPPAFGRGTQGQVWQFNESFPQLLAECRQLLTPEPLFWLVTTYNIQASALMLANALGDTLGGLPGRLGAGEQVLREQSGGRLISTSIYARWQAR